MSDDKLKQKNFALGLRGSSARKFYNRLPTRRPQAESTNELPDLPTSATDLETTLSDVTESELTQSVSSSISDLSTVSTESATDNNILTTKSSNKVTATTNTGGKLIFAKPKNNTSHTVDAKKTSTKPKSTISTSAITLSQVNEITKLSEATDKSDKTTVGKLRSTSIIASNDFSTTEKPRKIPDGLTTETNEKSGKENKEESEQNLGKKKNENENLKQETGLRLNLGDSVFVSNVGTLNNSNNETDKPSSKATAKTIPNGEHLSAKNWSAKKSDKVTEKGINLKYSTPSSKWSDTEDNNNETETHTALLRQKDKGKVEKSGTGVHLNETSEPKKKHEKKGSQKTTTIDIENENSTAIPPSKVKGKTHRPRGTPKPAKGNHRISTISTQSSISTESSSSISSTTITPEEFAKSTISTFGSTSQKKISTTRKSANLISESSASTISTSERSISTDSNAEKSSTKFSGAL